VSERVGPLESSPWPSALEAHAVSLEGEVCLHGYEVESDLAAHYRFSDLVYLAVKGELPDDRRSRAFEVALIFALPLSVAEAPIHAAALARICGARQGGVLSVAGRALAARAEDTVRRYLPALKGEPSSPSAPVADGDAASVARLRALLEGVLDVPLLAGGPSRDLALLAVLWECGLRTESELVQVMTIARLPSAVAESSKRRPLDFASYPTDNPPLDYVSE